MFHFGTVANIFVLYSEEDKTLFKLHIWHIT
jgi:hypothetical protein